MFFIYYLVRKKLAAVAMAATGLIQPPKRVLGLELNIFSPFSGKKLAAAAMAGTGLTHPSKWTWYLEFKIPFLLKSCCGCYRAHPTVQKTFGFRIDLYFISWGKHLLPLLYILHDSTNPPKDFWVWN